MVRWPSDESSQSRLKSMKSNLATINEHLSRAFIGLHVPDSTITSINDALGRKRDESRWVDFRDVQLHRVFHDSDINLGGRFYGGWWQTVPSDYRRYIHLAVPGQSPMWTVEADFETLHPALLYAREGKPMPKDIYSLGGAFPHTREARRYAKSALLYALNAEDKSEATKALNSYVVSEADKEWERINPGTRRPAGKIEQLLPESCPMPSELLDQMMEKHAPIKGYFFSGISKALMHIDSQMAELVMLKMIRRGSLVLPVHDSFLVRKGDALLLRETMLSSIKEITGRPGLVKENDTELDIFMGKRSLETTIVNIMEFNREILREDREKTRIYWTLREDWQWEAQDRTNPRRAVA